MPKYSRITDDEADDDSVALIMGQSAPRLSRFGGTEYIRLENLDDQPEDDADKQRKAKVHEQFMRVRQSSSKLMSYIFCAMFGLVIFASLATIYSRKQRHAVENTVLGTALDPETTFSNGTHNFKRTTLMISLDAVHPHYVSAERTPQLNKMARSAFITPFIRPSFPTQTFPNHWTLVTGMYPINHGIVGNSFYDPELDLEFLNTDQSKSLDRRFWGGEPLWITAKKHGLKSAVHMWPGSEADWGTDAPDEVDKFNINEELSSNLDRITEWLDREHPPQLMLSYAPTVDTAGHKAGIYGPEMDSALLKVDNFIGGVRNAIAKRNLTHIVNLVVVSDHGMAPVSEDRVVFLDEVVNNYDKVTSDKGWPLAGLRFNKSSEMSEAMSSLKYYAHRDGAPIKGYKAYFSDQMPARWQFSASAPAPAAEARSNENITHHKGPYSHRLAPLYVVPDIGYTLTTHEDFNKNDKKLSLKGVHGYDNDEPLMRAMFMAEGPAFPKGKYAAFDNINVYSAICRSLGFEGSEYSDGDFHGVKTSSPLIKENYPGVDFVKEFYKGSSFSEFYEIWT